MDVKTGCYARFSSDLQKQTSIDDQVRECRDVATRRGFQWQSHHVYADKGISGTSIDGRPGLQALLAASRQSPRPFDVLLVDDSSRIARDLPDALRTLQNLQFVGVRVIYISQGIDSDSDQAEMMVAVNGLIDASYIKGMTAKIKRGLRGQLERGFATGAVTYGYDTFPVPDVTRKGEAVGYRLAINEDEAAIVRQVFTWYADDGLSLPQILTRLQDRRAPPPRGPGHCGDWRRSAVHRLLQNEKYTGKQIWGKTQTVRVPGLRKKVARPVPRQDWLVYERPDLRIIDEDLWERAQTRRRVAASATTALARSDRPNLIGGRQSALQARHCCRGSCGAARAAPR
jgi:DNA invertase Pin-like site-specific DNA recombinase